METTAAVILGQSRALAATGVVGRRHLVRDGDRTEGDRLAVAGRGGRAGSRRGRLAAVAECGGVGEARCRAADEAVASNLRRAAGAGRPAARERAVDQGGVLPPASVPEWPAVRSGGLAAARHRRVLVRSAAVDAVIRLDVWRGERSWEVGAGALEGGVPAVPSAGKQHGTAGGGWTPRAQLPVAWRVASLVSSRVARSASSSVGRFVWDVPRGYGRRGRVVVARAERIRRRDRLGAADSQGRV